MHGRQLGRELGFPTANMEVADADTIESGVYESYVEIDGVEYKAMSNLGSNPSVGGGPRHLETHIFDFSGDLYGRRLRSSCGVRSATSASSIRWRSCSARSNGIAAVF